MEEEEEEKKYWACVVCVEGYCGRPDCPFVDVLSGDPSVKQDNIRKAQKIFLAFQMDYIKESLIQAQGVAAKKALVEDWLLQFETNKIMCKLFYSQDLVKSYQERFGPLTEEDEQAASASAAFRD